jgi:hypothetical protein
LPATPAGRVLFASGGVMTAAFSHFEDFRRLVEITRIIFTLGVNLFTNGKLKSLPPRENFPTTLSFW